MTVKKLRLDTITTTAAQKTHEGWVGCTGQAMVDGKKKTKEL